MGARRADVAVGGMTARDELLAALLVERYTSPWWVTAPTIEATDDDLTCARRRREMEADYLALEGGLI